MVKRCFVINCGTGRKRDRNNEIKFSLFKAPNNAALLEKWRRAVPIRGRELNSNDRICEKHFEKRYILPRFQKSRYGDFYEDNIRTKLAPDAVPTIFNDADSRVAPQQRNMLCYVKQLDFPGNMHMNSPNSLKLVLPPVEVHETDTVEICYKCLVGKCTLHRTFQNLYLCR